MYVSVCLQNSIFILLLIIFVLKIAPDERCFFLNFRKATASKSKQASQKGGLFYLFTENRPKQQIFTILSNLNFEIYNLFSMFAYNYLNFYLFVL
jgi:hypothetical protein